MTGRKRGKVKYPKNMNLTNQKKRGGGGINHCLETRSVSVRVVGRWGLRNGGIFLRDDERLFGYKVTLELKDRN